MRYLALASDYDGTLAHDGVVRDETIEAIQRLLHSGRKLILVTGRVLSELLEVFPGIDLCERVIAENGAVLYNPSTREKRVLSNRPPDSFLADLQRRGVSDVAVGDVIVATWSPHEREAIDAIRESGLELQIIFNKEAVMILPSGVNKMTGLCAALEELKLSRHNIVGVGDAENDNAFLESCELSVAVANAIPILKEKVSLVTDGARGEGVVELIEDLIRTDFLRLEPKSERNRIHLGKSKDGFVDLPAYGRNVLVCGLSGSGKSTIVLGLMERIAEKGYQMCLIDPEGDYENLSGFRTVGDEKRPPTIEHVKQVLEEPEANVAVNLVGVAASDRPQYFASLISQLQELRLRTGRPHWLVIDEAHHVLPSEWGPGSAEMAEEVSNLMLITVHPAHVSPLALKEMNTVVIVGREPGKLLGEFASAVNLPMPDADIGDLGRGEALLWLCDQDRLLPSVEMQPSKLEHSRHRRKYAQGQLEPERQFHFRGQSPR